MGIGIQALNLTLSLHKGRWFDGFQSVIELGSQEIVGSKLEIVTALNQALGIEPPESPELTDPEWVYKNIGFKVYKCIDTDGVNNSLTFDLNTDIVKKYGFKEKFDLVTNYGTSEHCFDQVNVFRNIHNLCVEGGIMIHGLPFQGYLSHGFYNYQPSFFFDLASSNNYQIAGIYLNIDSRTGDLSTYSDELMKYIHIVPEASMGLFVVLKKIADQEFRTPYCRNYPVPPAVKEAYQYANAPVRFFPIESFKVDPVKVINFISLKNIIRIIYTCTYKRFRTWLKLRIKSVLRKMFSVWKRS